MTLAHDALNKSWSAPAPVREPVPVSPEAVQAEWDWLEQQKSHRSLRRPRPLMRYWITVQQAAIRGESPGWSIEELQPVVHQCVNDPIFRRLFHDVPAWTENDYVKAVSVKMQQAHTAARRWAQGLFHRGELMEPYPPSAGWKY